MTEKDLIKKLDILEVDEETRKSVACSLIGHSKIQTHCFGYYYCGRCDAQVGDALGSLYDTSKVVVVGHKCATCESNFKNCTWEDKFMCPDPFENETMPSQEQFNKDLSHLREMIHEEHEREKKRDLEIRLKLDMIEIDNIITMCALALKQQSFDLVRILLEHCEDRKSKINEKLKKEENET